VIDFTRALESAWERMVIILFRPFDPAKWGLMGFIAFLAVLAEGGVNFNNPLPMGRQNTTTTTHTYQSLPAALHAFKQFTAWLGTLSGNPWLALFVALGALYVVLWLVLNWVGCRAEFVFIDNIVRNRAALVWPWKYYARQGNVWFLFHLGLTLLYVVLVGTTVAAFLFLNWAWINGERDPNPGEYLVVGMSLLVFAVASILGGIVLFLIRSLVQPLYFKQTMGLGQALTAVLSLIFTQPLSLFVYLLLSFAIGLAAGLVACLIFCATCCVIIWVSCVPFAGSLLLSAVLCQLILPILVFTRCFQLDCLAQFGPQYDVWNVPPAPGPAAPVNPLPPPG
jgi:hypothetical protein